MANAGIWAKRASVPASKLRRDQARSSRNYWRLVREVEPSLVVESGDARDALTLRVPDVAPRLGDMAHEAE